MGHIGSMAVESPEVSVTMGDGEVQRRRVIALICRIAILITVVYVAVYWWKGWDVHAVFSASFVLWYGSVYVLVKWGWSRVAGVVLIGVGTLQLGLTNLLLVPASLGNQIFIMLLPIFALIVIHTRDRIWAHMYTLLAVLLTAGFEYGRDTYIPPYAEVMDPGEVALLRSMSAAITVLMVVWVYGGFYGDLREARRALRDAHARSESLLLNILPPSIAERLKEKQQTIADDFEDAGVLFADVVGFTTLASGQTASETVVMLNSIFSRLDASVDAHGLEKVKTIGDAYMVASG
ncbi:MAG: adenylate/guanylate cyclase domain-containing protein, partial [Myxococcota bacterium]|nr:adenylate/guanylate cyclase domain-containing protein [Myxococcota bacterium]